MVTGVIDLGTIGDNSQGIHVRLQGDDSARLGFTGNKNCIGQVAFNSYRHITKEIDIGNNIFATQLECLEPFQEVFPAPRYTLNCVKHPVARLATATPNGVMAAKGIFNYRKDRACFVRIKDVPLRQFKC
jgi:hypothetical protein